MRHICCALYPERSAPRLARTYAAAACGGWPHELVEVVRVVTSELVTNAVVHGSGDVLLDVRSDAGAVRVSVADGGETMPRAPEGDDHAAESGRGLVMVAELTDAWGVSAPRGSSGKTVWAELRRAH